MNGFRITVLTLLCLSVGLMFYAVLFVIPAWQGEYSAYQSSLRIEEYQKKNDIHRQQMQVYDPNVEAPEVEQARLEQEEAARRDEASLNEAEESNVVAAAKRKEEVARAAASRQQDEPKDARSAVVGIVASYDPEWNCVMIKPEVPDVFTPGAVVAVWRDKYVVCEAVVDNIDSLSGQVSATLKEADFGQVSVQIDEQKFLPRVGDEVIVSPFADTRDLRGDAPGGVAPDSEQLPEVPGTEASVSPQPAPVSAGESREQKMAPDLPDSPDSGQPQISPAESSSELPSLDDSVNTLEQ